MIIDEGTSNFASRVIKLMERVHYKRADTREDREAIFRMRYEAYLREGYIKPNDTGLFTDPDDESPNAWLVGCYVDNELALSIRLHIASQPDHFLPVMRAFSDVVGPRLEAGALIVDCSRMTTRLDLARAYPFLPYLGVRVTYMADDFFGADFLTVACREDISGAYRRMSKATVWAAPRPYPPLIPLNMLVGVDLRQVRAEFNKRFPFHLSTAEEQASLFKRSSNSDTDFYTFLNAARRARAEATRQQETTCAA